MRVPKGMPEALLTLPARVVPGLVLLGVLEYAGGGRLWGRLLMHGSAGLLHPDNVWGFAVVVGLVLAVVVGQLLAAIGNIIEQLTDHLLSRELASEAYDWLRVHEPQAGELVTVKRAEFKLLYSLAATLLVSFLVSLVAVFSAYLCLFFALSSLLVAWRGFASKSTFRETAEKLRDVALSLRPAAYFDTRSTSGAT